MPWCPDCKTEYRKGITMCNDCGKELVESLEEVSDYVILCSIEKEEVAKKLVKYLSYSNLESYYEYSNEEDCYPVYVHEPELKMAKKAFNAFYTVELESMEKDADNKNLDTETSLDSLSEEDNLKDNLDDLLDSMDDDSNESSRLKKKREEEEKDQIVSMMYDGGAYEKKSEKSKELRSTALTFFAFGIGGIAFVILNIMGVISFISGPLSYTVMTGLFIAFLAIGVNSVTRAKKTAKEAILEDEMTTKINRFLEANVTEQVITSMKDENSSEEANFIKVMEGIKKLVVKEFGSLDNAFLDYIVEEFYNNHFDSYDE
ncbi:hypothetical protein [Lachnoclostridium sp.]|uniref:hypothetical protein n=1 Tax=Lachnoclostridium sp. TaxID=2028282 RepID=UPI00289BC254|nr:hypothetical protein [Lachnoclostridium sp.]